MGKFIDKNIAITGDIYDQHISKEENWFGDVPPFTNLEINIRHNQKDNVAIEPLYFKKKSRRQAGICWIEK